MTSSSQALSAAPVVLDAEEAAPIVVAVLDKDIAVVDGDDITLVIVNNFRDDMEARHQFVVDVGRDREILEIIIADFEVEGRLLGGLPGAADPGSPLAAPRSVVVRAVVGVDAIAEEVVIVGAPAGHHEERDRVVDVEVDTTLDSAFLEDG